ncbi:MAG: hypothetical protein ACK5LN_08980 [Propioniciclava sp.]
MKRRLLVSLTVLGVLAVAVLVFGVSLANNQGRDEFTNNITYRDPDRSEPIAVDLSYELDASRTEQYHIRTRSSPRLAISWASPAGEPGVEIVLEGDQGVVQQVQAQGTQCQTWAVEPDTTYTLSVTLNPGSGQFSAAWQEAASCA